MTRQKAKRYKEKPPKKPIRTAVLIFIAFVVLVLIIGSIYAYSILNNMNIENVKISTEEPLATDEIIENEQTIEPAASNIPTVDASDLATPEPELIPKSNEEYGIINIMVFGMDNRYKRTIAGGRSDVNMILTLDTINKKKLFNKPIFSLGKNLSE